MNRGREARHARIVLGALIAGAVLAGNGALVYLGGTYAYYSDTSTVPLVEITFSPDTTTSTTTTATSTTTSRTRQAPAEPEAGKRARPPDHGHAATRTERNAVKPPTPTERAKPHLEHTVPGPGDGADHPGLVRRLVRPVPPRDTATSATVTGVEQP